MKAKKILFFSFILFLAATSLFAQAGNTSAAESTNVEGNTEAAADSENAAEKAADGEEAAENKTFFDRANFVMELTPGVYVSPTSSTLVAQTATPIYPFAFGFIWPNDFWIAVEPTINFFAMYHLWYNGTAFPAEPEKRTSQTFDFMLNIPVSISLIFKQGVIQLTPGIGILARFGILAYGISEDDSGASGTAKSDLDLINAWFWQNARFLYLTIGGTYLIKMTDTVRGGPTLHAYIPVGTVFSGEGVQGMIFSVGMKLVL